MKMIVVVKNRADLHISTVEVEVERKMNAEELRREAGAHYDKCSGNENPENADLLGGVMPDEWGTIFWGGIVLCRLA